MQAANIHHIEFVLLFLLLLVAALAGLARRFHTPYPIVLVVGGLAVSLVPNLPHVSLNPDVVFLILLPPLLFSAAFNTSWRDFRMHLSSISLLAFGLVGFTVVGVAYLSRLALPSFDHRLGYVLGAVVASTDAIAATAIAKRMGLPRRIIDVLEGESLVNDATSLVALEFSVAMLVSNETPSITGGLLHLLWLAAAGIGIGLLVGRILRWAQLKLIDAPVEIMLTLVAPYLSYIAAESIQGSGVLATVACGLYLGHKRSELLSTRARLESLGVWNTLDFVLNGLVFIMIGLQLPYILAGIRSLKLGDLLFYAALLSGALIALRLIWVYAESWILYVIGKMIGLPDTRPDARETFVIGWTGMRGVISLAAAISLPEFVGDGTPFPQRNVIIFLTFCVILVTLVAQGLSLPWLIRKLGVVSAEAASMEEQEARRQMLTAALNYIGYLRGRQTPGEEWMLEDLLGHYQRRLEEAQPGGAEEHGSSVGKYEQYRVLSNRLRAVERSTVLRMRDEEKINDEVLRTLERELDLMDARYATAPH